MIHDSRSTDSDSGDGASVVRGCRACGVTLERKVCYSHNELPREWWCCSLECVEWVRQDFATERAAEASPA